MAWVVSRCVKWFVELGELLGSLVSQFSLGRIFHVWVE